MSYHNPKQTKQNKQHRRLNLNKRPSARTASHIRMPGVLLHSILTLAPTNSTLEVHSFMWCPFPSHLWQVCVGHCWMKWLLSQETKHLLSFRARRPPRIMRILLGDAPSLMLLRCSAPDQAFLVRRLERCASRPLTLSRRSSPVARRGRRCPVHYLGHGHRQRLHLRADVFDCCVKFLAGDVRSGPPWYLFFFFRSLGD